MSDLKLQQFKMHQFVQYRIMTEIILQVTYGAQMTRKLQPFKIKALLLIG